MTLLKVDSVEQAREKILQRAKTWPLKTETMQLSDLDTELRILAQDVYARDDIPGFSR